MYNLTAYDNVNSPLDFWTALQVSSGNILTSVFLFVLTIVLFMISRQFEEDMAKCMVFSGIITSIVGLLFVFSGILDWNIFMFTVIFLFSAMVVFSLSKN